MKQVTKVGFAAVLTINLLSIAHADESGNKVKLDAVEVVGQKFKEKDKAYMKSGAVSIRDEINKANKDLDTIIRSTPGTYTQMNKASGTVSVNIRGGTGFGRVNTMVDGVTQTFYSSSADTGARGGGAGSQFGATIDPAFLTSVEINRGSFKGASGANSLMGSANFKTIGVDDILRFDRNIGGMVKFSNGGNDLHPEYMLAVAGKQIFDYGGWFGVLYGYSRKTISQNYEVGGGKTHEQISKEITEQINEHYKNAYGDDNAYNVTPFDPEKVKQKPENHLFKVEYGDDYNMLELQYRKATNHLAGRSIEADTKQINYNFSIPDNNFMNLNLLYSNNKNTQNYDVGSTIIDRMVRKPLKGENKSTTFDISNTFEFNLPLETTLTMTTGLNHLKNKYSKNRYPDELRIFKICPAGDDSPECVTSLGELNPTGKTNLYTRINASLPTNSFFPEGDQKFKTLYLNNTLEWNILKLDYNINLVKYKTMGQILTSVDQEYNKLNDKYKKLEDEYNKLPRRDKFGPKGRKLQSEMAKIDIEKDEFDQKYDWGDIYDENGDFIMEGYRKRPTFSNYAEVSGSFRNYSLMLTANINDYFTPFISYSKTHRAPTVQEIFFSSLADAGVRLGLKPETARTKQIGFNGFLEGAITDNDKIGYKFTAYKTEINDFIHNVYGNKRIRGINPLHGSQTVPALYHRNYDQLVTIKGFEAEFSYDIGRFFVNVAYAQQKTNQPASYSDIPRTATNSDEEQAEAQSFGLTKVAILPDKYGSIELGTRFFDEKITIGAIAKYYGKSKRTKFDAVVLCQDGKIKTPSHQCYSIIGGYAEYEEVDSQPIIYDLYAIYKPNENFMFKLTVDNLTDKRYINPLDANNDSASQYDKRIHSSPNENGEYYYTKGFQNNFARGRTAKLSFSYKF